MSTQENVQIVKDFFSAIGSGDKQRLLALVGDDIEWIIPGGDWPLAGAHRGHAGVAAVLQKASKEIEMTYPKPPEFVAYWSSESLTAKSNPRIRRLWTIGSSTPPFEMGN
jgi:hypothetical protein